LPHAVRIPHFFPLVDHQPAVPSFFIVVGDERHPCPAHCRKREGPSIFNMIALSIKRSYKAITITGSVDNAWHLPCD
jgi:hypothetical protein